MACFVVLLFGPVWGASAQPVNDDCATPTEIAAVPFEETIDTATATTAVSDPPPSCTAGQNSHSVWYSYTAAVTGRVIAKTAGSTYRTVLTAYAGSCPALTEVACDQVFGVMAFVVTAGTTYLLEIAAEDQSAAGTLHFSLDFAPPAPNDDCATPTVISALSFHDVVDTTLAAATASDPRPSCTSGGQNFNSVWYRLTATNSGFVSIDARSSGYPTVVTVYTGSCNALMEFACGADGRLIFSPSAATTYLVEVAARFASSGVLDLTLSQPPCGNGISDPGEECDDGNNVSCDGCSDVCQLETGYVCGDGLLHRVCGEQCDDGNTTLGDGCSEHCSLEHSARACQIALAKAGKRYFTRVMKIIQSCRMLEDTHAFVTCTYDLDIVSEAKKARAKLQRACTDGSLVVLRECAGTLDGLVTVDGTSGCFIAAHRNAVDAILAAEYGF